MGSCNRLNYMSNLRSSSGSSNSSSSIDWDNFIMSYINMLIIYNVSFIDFVYSSFIKILIFIPSNNINTVLLYR